MSYKSICRTFANLHTGGRYAKPNARRNYVFESIGGNPLQLKNKNNRVFDDKRASKQSNKPERAYNRINPKLRTTILLLECILK